MLISNNILYGEKSGYIVRYNNQKEKEFWENYICGIEKEIVPSFYSKDELYNLNRNLPSSGGINLSDNCQLRCNYCAFSSGGAKRKTLKLQDAKAYVAFLFRNAKLKEITFGLKPFVHISFAGGGEPTFNWNLLKEIIEFSKKLCIDKQVELGLAITTNGILDDKKITYLNNTFNSIMVSYDGIADVQNKNRTGNDRRYTNDIVEHTIETLLNQGANLTIRTTVWPDQYERPDGWTDRQYNPENFPRRTAGPLPDRSDR